MSFSLLLGCTMIGAMLAAGPLFAGRRPPQDCVGRRHLSGTVRAVPRECRRQPSAFARRLAEDAGQPHPANLGFRLDDGRGLPADARGAQRRRELSGHPRTRAGATGGRVLQRRSASAFRPGSRKLDWLESVAGEYAVSDERRNHERSSSADEIEMGVRIRGRRDGVCRAHLFGRHDFRGQRGRSGAGAGSEDGLPALDVSGQWTGALGNRSGGQWRGLFAAVRRSDRLVLFARCQDRAAHLEEARG